MQMGGRQGMMIRMAAVCHVGRSFYLGVTATETSVNVLGRQGSGCSVGGGRHSIWPGCLQATPPAKMKNVVAKTLPG